MLQLSVVVSIPDYRVYRVLNKMTFVDTFPLLPVMADSFPVFLAVPPMDAPLKTHCTQLILSRAPICTTHLHKHKSIGLILPNLSN